MRVARRWHSLALAVVLACGAGAAAGCVSGPTGPAPERSARITLASEGVERYARRLTYRIRNTSCVGIATGSGFAISKDVIITNAHVAQGARKLQLSTWDGKDIDVEVSGVATSNDLALIKIDGEAPEIAAVAGEPARRGDAAYAVGYPLGGKWTLTSGEVVDRVDGDVFDEPAEVLRLTTEIQHGNSGGPLLDEYGDLIGVVFALEVDSGYGLAISAEDLRGVIENNDWTSNPEECDPGG